jgi:hypothetical protein
MAGVRDAADAPVAAANWTLSLAAGARAFAFREVRFRRKCRVRRYCLVFY